jgi:hypothetical protein
VRGSAKSSKQAAKPSMRASNRRVLNAAARIDSQETRKVQLHCQPVSNAIPLGIDWYWIDFKSTQEP